MERQMLHLEDLNGHGNARTLDAVQDALKETGGIAAIKNDHPDADGKPMRSRVLVKCAYDPSHNAYGLSVLRDFGWEAVATYSQNRVEMAALDFVREVFEAEGRDA